jgi:hypothetical protein
MISLININAPGENHSMKWWKFSLNCMKFHENFHEIFSWKNFMKDFMKFYESWMEVHDIFLEISWNFINLSFMKFHEHVHEISWSLHEISWNSVSTGESETHWFTSFLFNTRYFTKETLKSCIRNIKKVAGQTRKTNDIEKIQYGENALFLSELQTEARLT